MATVTESRDVPNPDTKPGVRIYTWVLTTANADGNPVDLTPFPDKTVHIFGTFGSGTLTIQGSNDGSDWQSLRDPQGNAIAKTASYLGAILENPRYLRPNLTGSTGATVTVILVARGVMPV